MNWLNSSGSDSTVNVVVTITVIIIRRNCLALQLIPPIPAHCSVVLVCRLSHSCTLLKPFDGFRWHLAGTLVGVQGHIVSDGVPDPPGEGEISAVESPAKTCSC